MDTQSIIRKPFYGQGGSFTYTGTAGTSSAIPSGGLVWLYTTTDSWVVVDVGATATVTCLPLPAFTIVTLPCLGGARVSAVQQSAGGTCYFCPIGDA